MEAEFNSKRLYCVRQARRKFYGDTAAGIELGGYPGELVNVTPQSLKAEYDRILSTAYIDVMVQGVDEDRVADMLLKKLDGIRRDPHPFAAPIAMPATPLRHFKEEVPGLTQAKLCMLFTTGEATPQPAQRQHPARGDERAGRLRHQSPVPQRAREAVPVLLLRQLPPSGPPAL